MQAPLPTIEDYIKSVKLNMNVFRYFRPSATQKGGIERLHQNDSEASPASQILSCATMVLPPETIIPVHVHRETEKLYRFLSGSSMEVLMWRNEHIEKYTLTRGSEVVIPKNTPHAVINSCIDPCNILVTKSSQDTNDIEWEQATERLLENHHRDAAT